MAKLLAALTITAGAVAAGAWILMLLVGVIHADWLPALPTISYRTALLIGALLYVQALIRGLAGVIVKDLRGTPAAGGAVQRTPADTKTVHWVSPRQQADWNLW